MTDTLQNIVQAVLYEGYILYPYRASSLKNQRERFTFGRVYPERYSRQHAGAERCQIRSEVLLQTENGQPPEVQITFGFLQPILREIGVLNEPTSELPPADKLRAEVVPSLELNGKVYQTWMEAAERQVALTAQPGATGTPFDFREQCLVEPIADEQGLILAVIRRLQSAVAGMVTVETTQLQGNLWKVSARAVNRSPVPAAATEDSDRMLMSTLASSHFIFKAPAGRFVSLLETPDELKHFAMQCENTGVWPVLVGDPGADACRTMLASPIILYDYPEVAAESGGDFFDSTEIDEMLTLRVLTLTDSEKSEMQLDDFSRHLLERTQAMDENRLMKLHGQMRRPRDFSPEEFFNPTRTVQSVQIQGIKLEVGDRVVIRPNRRADAMDLLLTGKKAIIEALEQDAEGEIHLAVVLEEDPGAELGLARQVGHRFFYRTDEVEPCKPGVAP